MQILVTGTAGFIGFHLAKRLIELGHSVIGVDNMNDYYTVLIKEKRHAVLKEQCNFTEVITDIADTLELSRIFNTYKPDVVCNLAAQAGVRYSLKNPNAYIHSNINGFHTVADVCIKNNISRLVYASSSSVYGGNTKLPFSETDPVETPISLYAATKRSNELMAHAMTHLHGIQTVGLRFFTVYGPWGRPDMAIWQFTQKMLSGKPIDVYNYGNMRRDFTYIDDIINGTVSALTSDNLEAYEIFNLGNNKPVELMHLIELLEKRLGIKAETNMLPIQKGDVEATYADIEKANLKLGFKPTTRIEDGIDRFLSWVEENKKMFLETTFKK